MVPQMCIQKAVRKMWLFMSLFLMMILWMLVANSFSGRQSYWSYANNVEIHPELSTMLYTQYPLDWNLTESNFGNVEFGILSLCVTPYYLPNRTSSATCFFGRSDLSPIDMSERGYGDARVVTRLFFGAIVFALIAFVLSLVSICSGVSKCCYNGRIYIMLASTVISFFAALAAGIHGVNVTKHPNFLISTQDNFTLTAQCGVAWFFVFIVLAYLFVIFSVVVFIRRLPAIRAALDNNNIATYTPNVETESSDAKLMTKDVSFA